MAKDKEIIEQLKAKHGDIWEVRVDDIVAYVKKPTRAIQRAAARLGKDDPYKFNEVLVKNCFVGGDERIKDEENIDEAANQIADLIPQKAGSIKKC